MSSGACSAEPRRKEPAGDGVPAEGDRPLDTADHTGLARPRRRRPLVAPSATR